MLFLLSSSPKGSNLKWEVDKIFWLYFICHLVQTTYCFVWDIYMDWGLFRQNKPGSKNRFLREKINYNPRFYYWAIFSDFILRYIYILFMYNLGQPDSFFNNLELMFAI